MSHSEKHEVINIERSDVRTAKEAEENINTKIRENESKVSNCIPSNVFTKDIYSFTT